MNNVVKVKPITICKSIWYFITSSFLIYLGLYVIIPNLLGKGVPFMVGYLVFFYAPFVLMFIIALILYSKEGNSWRISDFMSRMRLNPLKKADWLWVAGIILFSVLLMAAAQPLMSRLAEIPLFRPPDFFPAEINPNKTAISGYMMDYELSGEYWIIPVYVAGWFFNIFGEELLWRGILLPRQVQKYGSKTWVIHGVLWGLWHFFWKWQLVVLIPMALLLSYAACKRKNTWIGIIAHGITNFIPLIVLTVNIFS